MSVPNPFAITFGDLDVGGTTPFQLLGPYAIDKSYEGFRLTFDIVVTADSLAAVQALADDLETNFRRRLVNGDQLVISLGGATWTYRVGETLLAVTSEIQKRGNREVDLGFSRAYTCTVHGELPADQDNALRDVEVLVHYLPSRQRTVTMRGTYTADDGGGALENYQSSFDGEALLYLNVIDSNAKWELVDESATLDRHRTSAGSDPRPHLCNFTRQYTELLADQSQGQRDDNQIRDHRIVFTDLSQNPADSKASIHRLRRVVGTYDCSVDITETTDLHDVFDSKVRQHITRLFRTEFSPQVFCLEEQRIAFDETAKRISVQFQFLYHGSDSGHVIEVAQSVAYKETRTIDYTPVHGTDEFAAEADVGFAVRERHWNRTAVVLGVETPKLRISAQPLAGDAGLFTDTIGGIAGPDFGNRSRIAPDGWNIISSTSQVTPQFVGDPSNSNNQIQLYIVSEVVVERFHKKPAGAGTGPVTPR